MSCLVLALVAAAVVAMALAPRLGLPWLPRAVSPRRDSASPTQHGGRFRPKPPWVHKEVIRLKAFMPKAGCRTISLTFKRLHDGKSKRPMLIGKSYFAEVLKRSQEEGMQARRRLRRRKPRASGRNRIWALDLTYAGQGGGQPLPLLGVLDHGTRACLALQALERKTTVAVLRALLDLVERFGRPAVLRTDNEATFTSRLFRFALFLLGTRHQRTEPFAPWQNGRVKSFFGTFKRCRRELLEKQPNAALGATELRSFRLWYNHLRPHQSLEGLTSAEAWSCQGKGNRVGKAVRLEAWGGVLSGFYVPNRPGRRKESRGSLL